MTATSRNADTTDLGGRTALVTGAAGGIGAAVVRTLHARGARVAAVDLDPTALKEALHDVVADGVETVAADVTRRADVREAVAGVEQRLGPVDLLVNAAGVLRTGACLDLDDDDWDATFAVNTDGVFHVSRAVVPGMVQRGRGAVVTVASNAANTPRAGMGAYAASKAATAMFTKCLGLEVAAHGVRCNVVAPGSTDTPMLSSMWHDESGPTATLDGSLEAYRVGIPLRKLAQPADIAAAVAFLLSDAAGHITLHELTVDGGAGLGA